MKTIVFIFLNFFVLVVGATLLFNRFREKRQRSQVAKMLRTEAKPEAVPVSLLRDKERSQEPAGNKDKNPMTVARRLEDLLLQADIAWTVSRLLTMAGCLALLGFVMGAVFPVLLNRAVSMLVFPFAAGALPVLYVRRVRGKRLEKLEQQLPDAMDFLARSMRAGHAFSISIGMVGNDLPAPLGREFRTLYNEQNLGAPLETAFANFLRRVPLIDARLFCSAATLQRRTGGNLSQLLVSLSEIIRDRFRLKGQVKAASGHARMTAGILTALPALTMCAFMVVAPSYISGLWEDPDGKKLVGAAIAAQAVGKLVIGRIVKVKV
jgi:tight adherence protein B